MMPNHWTIYRGQKDIGEMMRAGKDYIFKIRDREVLDFGVSGSLAYTVNSYYYTWHAKDDTAQWHHTKNVHLWKLDDKNNWRLYLDIWNSNVPLSAFNSE
jgi:ketosteroid isomerase-like protein